MKKTFFLLVALLATAAARADILQGRVVDAETGEPLDGARVEATMASGEGTSNWTLQTDTLGRFQMESIGTMRRITLRAEFFGYQTETVRLLASAGTDTVRLADIRLRPSEVLMRELAVEGRARRFYMRGDTVVFNPRGFPVEDSDRLQDLVLRLPGVSLRDGQLFWNGKPVRLMMNGHEALSEDMLLRQLPVEAVENIKAYERRSELEERTGIDDGRREQVLDVTIRPRFMDRWSGEVKATAYSRPNYAATADAMRLSDTDPVMMNLRLADDPRAVVKNTFDNLWDYGTSEATRQQMGNVGYKHAWKGFEGATRDSYWALVAGANHRDTPHSRWEHAQTYLPGTQPTETDTEERTDEHHLSTPLDFASRIDLSPNTRMQWNATLAYEQDEQTADRQQRTFSLPLREGRGGTAASYQSASHSDGLSVKVQNKFLHMLDKGMLGAGLDVDYRHRKERGSSLGTYHYLQDGTTTLDAQRFRAPADNLSLDLHLAAMQTVGKKATLAAQWTTAYGYTFRDEQRWRADTLDLANSLHRRDNLWRNELELMAQLTLGKFSLQPSLMLTHRHEQSDYKRGMGYPAVPLASPPSQGGAGGGSAGVDTLARRNLLLTTPMFEVDYRLAQQQGLKALVSYVATPSQLIDGIAYTDDTNPLYITEGNPGLRTSHTLSASLTYNLMRTRGSQSLGIELRYARDYDPIATVLHYNSQTGGYRSWKSNVRGGSRWEGSIDYDRSLAKNLQMKNLLSGQWGTSYGLLTLVDEATGLTYNRQARSNLRDRLALTYDASPWRAELMQEFTWNNYTYSDAAQPVQNIFRYEAALRLRYTLRNWKFTLDPQLYVNRGYLAPAMNDTPFLLNAGVSYKFSHSERSSSGTSGSSGGKGSLLRHLSNRAEVSLYARDLLNRNRRHSSTITATSHTEGGESSLHSYVTLTLRYRWDPPKKEK
ncbi:MAG: carboxypeptidase regulatory-like domain-containing protein [Bacteroidaceae bacterium]|nr:carboxypeptidase regulatory-like domain-containing protein [Bacteroidaceae bacterium]